MKTIWKIIGRVLGYLTWPLAWLVLRFTTRTRVMVVYRDEVLILQGWLSTAAWSFPGGGKHPSEKPVEAALRELEEEIGIVVKDTELKPMGLMKQTKGHAYRFYGFAAVLSQKPRLQLQPTEVTNAKWVKLNNLLDRRMEQHVQLLADAWQKQR